MDFSGAMASQTASSRLPINVAPEKDVNSVKEMLLPCDFDSPEQQEQERQGLIKINQFDPRADLALAQARPLIVSHTPVKVLDATPPAQIPQCPPRWACRAACEMTSTKHFSPVSRHHRPNDRVGRGVDSRYRRVCRPRRRQLHLFSVLRTV